MIINHFHHVLVFCLVAAWALGLLGFLASWLSGFFDFWLSGFILSVSFCIFLIK